MTYDQLEELCAIKHDLDILEALEDSANQEHWIQMVSPETRHIVDPKFKSIICAKMIRGFVTGLRERVEMEIEKIQCDL